MTYLSNQWMEVTLTILWSSRSSHNLLLFLTWWVSEIPWDQWTRLWSRTLKTLTHTSRYLFSRTMDTHLLDTVTWPQKARTSLTRLKDCKSIIHTGKVENWVFSCHSSLMWIKQIRRVNKSLINKYMDSASNIPDQEIDQIESKSVVNTSPRTKSNQEWRYSIKPKCTSLSPNKPRNKRNIFVASRFSNH